MEVRGGSWAACGRAPRAARPNAYHQHAAATSFSIQVSGPGSSPTPDYGAPDGQVNAALMASMAAKIGAALETDRVSVADASGDGRHVEIEVVSPLFDGRKAVDRQRMVYKAIWEELQETVHAVDAMVCRSPAEADG